MPRLHNQPVWLSFKNHPLGPVFDKHRDRRDGLVCVDITGN